MKTPNGQDMPRFVPRVAPQTWAIKIASVKMLRNGGATLTFEGDYYAPVEIDKELASRKPKAGDYYRIGPDGFVSVTPAKQFDSTWKAAT